MALADFSRASALGFVQGQQMAEGQNPLGQFIRGMLDEYRQKKAMEQEVKVKMGVEVFKNTLETTAQKEKEEREQKNPLNIAKTRAYNAKAEQIEKGKTVKDKEVSDVQKFKLSLWKQAESEAFKESGGSLMVGIGTKNKEAYKQRRKSLYQEYLKQFNITDLSEPKETSNPLTNVIPQEEESLIDYEF